MSETPIAKPVPEASPALAPFFAAARAGRLVVQRCAGCGALRFPPRELCSRCLGLEATWQDVSGRGEIFSYNVMHQVYHPGFAADVPYAVVIVKLEEGPKITSNLVGCPVDEIAVGMPVEVAFEQLSPEVTLPKFRRRRC
ncbi:MAG: OB-fold domain-containing protein [Deltaproteobacteria bacterium]|nr:OB-fold domain-containing protein [Deltaproteobacteria bacterium]